MHYITYILNLVDKHFENPESCSSKVPEKCLPSSIRKLHPSVLGLKFLCNRSTKISARPLRSSPAVWCRGPEISPTVKTSWEAPCKAKPKIILILVGL